MEINFFFFFCYDVTKRFVALFTTESELQWVTMREVPQRLASPSKETPEKKKKKNQRSCLIG